MSDSMTGFLSYGQQRARTPVVLGFEGTIVAGSYNAADGTAAVVIGETLSSFDDPSQQGGAIVGYLLTPMVGIQGGPQGGERALLIPTRGSYNILLHHGSDSTGTDAPGAPVGEYWIFHPKAGTVGAGNTPVYDAGIKLANDGPTPGDGLGSTTVGNEGALTAAQTKSGHEVTLNDTTKQVQVKTAGVGNPAPMTATFDDPTQTIKHAVATAIYSVLDAINQQVIHRAGTSVSTTLIDTVSVQQIIHAAAANVQTTIDGAAQAITHQASGSVKTIVDGAGNAISHVAPEIALGAAAGNGSLISAITHTDLNNVLTDGSTGINIQRLQDLRNGIAAILSAMGTSGVPSLPTLGAVLTVLWGILGISAPGLPGYASIPVPSGSSVVKMLP